MSVHKLKDGRWICRYPKGKDLDRPNTNKKYFGRGPEAEAAAIEYNASLDLGHRIVQKSPLFVELVNTYMEAKEHSLAPSSFNNLAIKMNGVIIPELGQTMIHNINAARLDKYVSKRARQVKLTTVHREISDIRTVLNWAVNRKLISSNPMAGFEMPKRDDARIQPPTKAEFDAILACAVPHMKRAMLISYHTGLRPGKEELLRLTWDSVDFINRTLTVLSADKGGIPVRVVPLNKTIMGHLEAWYDEDGEKSVPYLVHYNGKSIDSLKTAWRTAKNRARVTRRLRMYDIRHAFITTLLERGADLKSVSEIVGHASPDMTIKVYQHVSNQQKRNAVDLIE
ncbi:tyrosine-type recombinase/integrase [Desulforhopalus singaporensis]|uniref:Site-specific recombinase XerD n=1 Tax=Desulforhopalus singaporensis TaxID=91360 RepID=A0A1H0UV90_9BACT|nr:site-specific integrase [Desulforhopalus singaporensis]SDP70021.1 Site-specific recombinase XerD [Desulforhopalus singaporensis]